MKALHDSAYVTAGASFVAAVVIACTPSQAKTVADVALAAEQGACVRIHDTDPDAGPVLATVCRNAPSTAVVVDTTLAIAEEVREGGLSPVNPALVSSAVTAAQSIAAPPHDAGGQ